MAEARIGKAEQQVLFDREVALRGEDVGLLREDVDELLAAALKLENLGFEQAEAEAPGRVTLKQTGLLGCGFLASEIELASQKLLMDPAEDCSRIFGVEVRVRL